MSERTCAWQECGLPLVRREDESASNFAKRRACNRTHARRAKDGKAPVACPRCQQMFIPRHQQVYCSVECLRKTAREIAKTNYKTRIWLPKRNAQAAKAAATGPAQRFETVAEWLAAGNVVTRIEAPPHSVTLGVPVRGKASEHSGGRVRR